MIQVKRALLSVYDKSGILEFARALDALGIEIISTGGTARHLTGGGVRVTPIDQLSGLPDLFEGRLKTLTPQVHGGLLMRRDRAEDRKQAEDHGIAPIDLLCVNLYPFEETVARSGADRASCIEMIDIGGPAMIRAAAKNHRHVVVVPSPSHYEAVAARLAETPGQFPEQEAARLAAEAFGLTCTYDAAIYRYLRAEREMPEYWAAGGKRLQGLRYGENPNQQASCYISGEGFWKRVAQLQGKELSYNNFADTWAAWQCLGEFGETACVIIKHGTPCGVALGASPAEAFERARDCDALSAFGGIVLLNRPADEAVARLLTGMFLEVVGAPSWAEDAKVVLKKKKNLRLLTLPPQSSGGADAADLRFRSLGEAVLVQTPMPPHTGTAQWKCVTEAEPDGETLRELDFAWRVTRHVRSNAIVLSKNGQSIGLGCGQTSRIDAAEVALLKAQRAGHATAGSVLASDAFFPFRDVVDRAAQMGVSAIVQPGGSRRDNESIAACNQHGIAMLLTGERVFMH
ncbi:MAG: bifunctional phosphoribosylaminoimidazolecarboxamide formyltransferase/IMP cyclohydrolase [Candidatus Eisenbacteria sp.]|nr:bifunctional phosphoribosylaminoimidazolecarboxamide formyltransferase/IMP cyclohydrolase [Candidatus Eisenbacteria bacterium]